MEQRKDIASVYLEGIDAQCKLDAELNKLLGFEKEESKFNAYKDPFVSSTSGDTYDWSLEIHIYNYQNPEEFKLSEEKIETICSWGICHFWINFYDEKEAKLGDFHFSKGNGQEAYRPK